MAERITLSDMLPLFHASDGWAHPQKPCAIQVVVHTIRKREKGVTDEDLMNLVAYLHKTWDKGDIWARARIEIRHIVADRCQAKWDMAKRMDVDAAEILSRRLADYNAQKARA